MASLDSILSLDSRLSLGSMLSLGWTIWADWTISLYLVSPHSLPSSLPSPFWFLLAFEPLSIPSLLSSSSPLSAPPSGASVRTTRRLSLAALSQLSVLSSALASALASWWLWWSSRSSGLYLPGLSILSSLWQPLRPHSAVVLGSHFFSSHSSRFARFSRLSRPSLRTLRPALEWSLWRR